MFHCRGGISRGEGGVIEEGGKEDEQERNKRVNEALREREREICVATGAP